jgi:hypothetical protein
MWFLFQPLAELLIAPPDVFAQRMPPKLFVALQVIGATCHDAGIT